MISQIYIKKLPGDLCIKVYPGQQVHYTAEQIYIWTVALHHQIS